MTQTNSAWTPVPDGEYNEQARIINGQKITIYSDRDGWKWSCSIADEDSFDLDATDEFAARREAEKEAVK
jgi:hypothetical protein